MSSSGHTIVARGEHQAGHNSVETPGNPSKSRKSNQRKKRSVLKNEGVEGLIARNIKSRAARQRNHQVHSESYVRCAFECVGIRKGLVKRGKIALQQNGKGEPEANGSSPPTENPTCELSIEHDHTIHAPLNADAIDSQ